MEVKGGVVIEKLDGIEDVVPNVYLEIATAKLLLLRPTARFEAVISTKNGDLLRFSKDSPTVIAATGLTAVRDILSVVARSGTMIFLCLVQDNMCDIFEYFTLAKVKSFVSVNFASVDDFWSCGSQQVKLVFSNGNILVTDFEIPPEEVTEKNEEVLKSTLATLWGNLDLSQNALTESYRQTIQLEQEIERGCLNLKSVGARKIDESCLVRTLMGEDKVVGGALEEPFAHLLEVTASAPYRVGKRLIFSFSLYNRSDHTFNAIKVVPMFDSSSACCIHIQRSTEGSFCLKSGDNSDVAMVYSIDSVLDGRCARNGTLRCFATLEVGGQVITQRFPEVMLDISKVEQKRPNGSMNAGDEMARIKVVTKYGSMEDIRSKLCAKLGFTLDKDTNRLLQMQETSFLYLASVDVFDVCKNSASFSISGTSTQIKYLVNQLYNILPKDTVINNMVEERKSCSIQKAKAAILAELNKLVQTFEKEVLISDEEIRRKDEEDMSLRCKFETNQQLLTQECIYLPARTFKETRERLCALELQTDSCML